MADTLQSAITHAFRDFDRFEPGTNFRAWMFQYVRLEVLNRNRAHERRPDSLSASDQWVVDEQQAVGAGIEHREENLLEDPEAVLEHCDALVARCLRELTEQERRIFLMRSVGEFKYREIAEILEIPMGTVMGLLSRARKQLRRQLLEYARENRIYTEGDRP